MLLGKTQVVQVEVITGVCYPLLRVDRQELEGVEVGELQLPHYRLTKRAQHQLRLSDEQGDFGLEPAAGLGSGKPRDPEKKTAIGNHRGAERYLRRRGE